MRARDRWRADCARYFAYLENPRSRRARWRTLLTTEGLWAIGNYRFGQYLLEEASRPVRALLRFPYACSSRLLGLATGIHLFPSTRIGPGLYIGHYGNIWVSPLASLGARCNLSQGVTIGTAVDAAPVLGDRVWVGPNAVISGPVRVASGAVVAACSLVVAHVPENAVVIGVPAKPIAYTGSARLLGPALPEPAGGRPDAAAGVGVDASGPPGTAGAQDGQADATAQPVQAGGEAAPAAVGGKHGEGGAGVPG